MNKKSEFITLAIIMAIAMIMSLYLINEKISDKYQKVVYIGDSSIHVFYNLESVNFNCDTHSILIERANLVYFSSPEDAHQQRYNISNNCN